MDVRFVNPFITAISNVFKTMAATDTLIGKPFLKGPDDVDGADVSAVIGFSGDVAGMVVICLPEQTAVKIAGKLLGQEIKPDSPDMADALGEMINMIAGQAKSIISVLGGANASISLPRVFVGQKLQVLDSKLPTLVLPCDSALGRFRVEVTMDDKRAATPPTDPPPTS